MGLKKATVKLGADISEFQTKMRKASKSFKRMGKSMQRVGRSMSMSLTLPLAAFAAASVKAFDVQAKAEAKLLTGLKGNIEAFKSLKEQARELQKITLFGDEQTMSAQAMLATMGLEEEAIKRLTPLIQDMATAKGMDLKAAADLVAKSVGSSTNALSRYGITIEGAVGSTERLDSAVNALSGQFKGQSKAAAEAGAGGLTQLKNSFGDLMETIGGMLMPVLTKLIDKIKEGIEVIQGLSDEQLKSRIKWLAIAAAIGPVLIIVGKLTTAVGVLIPALSKLRFAILANPYLALAAAIALIITKMIFFSRKAKQVTTDLNNIEKSAKDAAKRLKEINDELESSGKGQSQLYREEILKIKETTKARINAIKKELKAFEGYKKKVSGHGGGVKDVKFGNLQTELKESEAILKTLDTTLNNVNKKEFDLTMPSVNRGTVTLIELDVEEFEEDAEEIDTTYGDMLVRMGEKSKAFYDQFGLTLEGVNEVLIGFIDQFSTGFVNLFDRVTDAEGKIVSFGEKFKNFATGFLKLIGKMIAQAAAFAFLMSITGLGKGASFTSLFEGALTGKASGGPVAGNTPYIVGEKGPELFVSNSGAGTIIPNHQLGGTQTIIPDVRISGSDLLIVFNKTRKEEGGVNV